VQSLCVCLCASISQQKPPSAEKLKISTSIKEPTFNAYRKFLIVSTESAGDCYKRNINATLLIIYILKSVMLSNSKRHLDNFW